MSIQVAPEGPSNTAGRSSPHASRCTTRRRLCSTNGTRGRGTASAVPAADDREPSGGAGRCRPVPAANFLAGRCRSVPDSSPSRIADRRWLALSTCNLESEEGLSITRKPVTRVGPCSSPPRKRQCCRSPNRNLPASVTVQQHPPIFSAAKPSRPPWLPTQSSMITTCGRSAARSRADAPKCVRQGRMDRRHHRYHKEKVAAVGRPFAQQTWR